MTLRSIPGTATGRVASVYARLTLGSAFLSAVAARLGLWDDRPRPFAEFTRYTGEVLAFMPRFTIPFFAVAATVAESVLGLLLLAGIRLRWTAFASALLLATFAISMAVSFGIKSPLDESVFSASAAALLLALQRVEGEQTATHGHRGGREACPARGVAPVNGRRSSP